MLKKLLQNHRLLLGLIFGILLVIPVYLFAQVPIQESYPALSGTTTPTYYTADGKKFNVMNLSSRNLFIPNKTMSEWMSFYNNNPNYTSISLCGDGACTGGETPENCSTDCSSFTMIYDFCGDGVCNTYKEVPMSAAYNSFTVYPIQLDQHGNPLSGGTYEPCVDDCGVKFDTCGICGVNSEGDVCQNWCNDGGFNMTNCLLSDGQNYPIAPEGLMLEGHELILNLIRHDNYLSFPAGHYYCANGRFNCPAGYFCSSGAQVICPAGYFCAGNSLYPRACPPGTYSTSGSSECTTCPLGSISAPKSTSLSACTPKQVCGDTLYQFPSGTPIYNRAATENRANCPSDAVDLNDGYCHIFEHGLSLDCACGNGVCDNGESNLVCPGDCPSCGDGACHSSETGICYTDCPSCNNNGVCEIARGEKSTNCSNDCFCGNGVCNSGETLANCPGDCHCGNGTCEPYNNGETLSNCSIDCYCGNNQCDAGELTFINYPNGSSASYETTCIGDCYKIINSIFLHL